MNLDAGEFVEASFVASKEATSSSKAFTSTFLLEACTKAVEAFEPFIKA